MRILHYALGFPPYRSGGLTKFCVDLMIEQESAGHKVAMLWPGQMGFVYKKTVIKKHKAEIIKGNRIQSYEIVNPLPVPFDEGITDIDYFIKDNGRKTYQVFLDEFQPEVIHVHTLMGIHKSFLEVAKEKNIRLVFTAHDFFPICPKVTMFRHGQVCSDVKTFKNCCICNATALSITKIKILQSPLYRAAKDFTITKKFRKHHRDEYLSESTSSKVVGRMKTEEDYKKLRQYYYSLLGLMDIIHYNSSVTKKVYESVFGILNNCILGITHSEIRDNRRRKEYQEGEMRIRYLGPQSGAKGFFILKKALDALWSQNKNFHLDIHFMPIDISPYMRVHERYSYSELENIFDETDILVAPSIWYETFGFTVLEGLSYGVPVVISGNVGAKDILADNAGIVIDNIDKQELCNVLQSLSRDKLIEMNNTIVKEQKILLIEDMSKQIEKMCYGW